MTDQSDAPSANSLMAVFSCAPKYGRGAGMYSGIGRGRRVEGAISDGEGGTGETTWIHQYS
eukprot:2751640-Pyramimonas_sp.AAC.2